MKAGLDRSFCRVFVLASCPCIPRSTRRDEARQKLEPVRLVKHLDLKDKFPPGNHPIKHTCRKNVPRSS
jgi:hypothetical protein